MQQAIINVPDNYPQNRLQKKIKEIEAGLKKEVQALQQKQDTIEDLDIDPWDALDIESIAVDSGRPNGSINHDHYIYGIPKR